MQPNTPQQKRAAMLLQRADHGIEVAELIVRESAHLYEDAGFHCQQAIEKYLKAALISSQLPSPYTHDLTALMDLLHQPQVVLFDARDRRDAVILNEFAVELRYETDDAPSYTAADLLAMSHRFQAKLRPLALAFLS